MKKVKIVEKLGVKFLGIFLIGIFLLQSNIVLAESETDKLKSQQNETNSQIQQKKEELNNIQEEKSDTMQQVEDLTNQISEYQSQIDELDSKITDLNSQISEAEDNLNKAQDEYNQKEQTLKERLVVSYEAGETSYLDVLLSSSSLTDLISSYYMISLVTDKDSELLQEIQEQKQQIETDKQNLENDKTELANSKTSKESMTAQLETVKKEKDSYVAKLSDDEKQKQSEIDQLQEDNEKISKELAAAEARYQKQLDELKRKQASGSGSSSNGGSSNAGGNFISGGTGYLQAPVKSGTITTQMYYSSGKYHGAIDYGVPVGTTVYAAADGVVLSATHLTTSYGNYIVIQHANGLRTWYAHGNGVFYVSAGDTVSKGQPIMQSGNSGNSTGPHLHFEVRVPPYNYSYSGNDSRRDPRNYM